MSQKDSRMIQAELAQPFAPEDLEWRLQYANSQRMVGLVVPFVTNRAIQSRLDDVVGPENWYNDYKPWHCDGKKNAQICGISIYFENRGFITKWDGAEDSDIEPVKGGLSDSMKRAAVQWGIGRVLYNMDPIWVDIEMNQAGKPQIKNGERAKIDSKYLAMLKKLNLVPAAPIGTQPVSGPAKKPQQHKAGTTIQMPQNAGQQPMPAYEYIVCSAQLQKGMSSSNTLVQLKSADGKTLQAFARGEHPSLVSGVMLTNVKLTTRQQETVVFHVLEAYQIAAPQQRAA